VVVLDEVKVCGKTSFHEIPPPRVLSFLATLFQVRQRAYHPASECTYVTSRQAPDWSGNLG